MRTLRRPRSAETKPDPDRRRKGSRQQTSGRRPRGVDGPDREATTVKAERAGAPVRRLRSDSEPGVGGRRYGARYLFGDWARVSRRLRAAQCVGLFTDFDGTLVPIRRRPNKVHLSHAGRRILARLARHARIRLWIVSARRLADIRRRTGRVGVRLAGLHGWEREDGGPPAVAGRAAVRQAARLLRERLRGLRGVWTEDKEWALAIHYRTAGNSAVRQARAALREALTSFAPALRLLPGKMVWEIIPRQIADGEEGGDRAY